MFCPNCGQQFAESEKFCGNCGHSLMPAQRTPANDFRYSHPTPRKDSWQNDLQVLDSLISHFSRKQLWYDEYDDSCDAVNYYARGARKVLFVWGSILSSFGLLFIVDSLDTFYTPMLLLCSLVITLLPGQLMIIGAIVMQICNRINYRKSLLRWKKLSDGLYQHYLAYPDCPVGPEYSNPQILLALRNALLSGRADSTTECLNSMINPTTIEKFKDQMQRNVAQTNTDAVVFLPKRFFC